MNTKDISNFTLHQMLKNADSRIARINKTLTKKNLDKVKEDREAIRIELENRAI